MDPQTALAKFLSSFTIVTIASCKDNKPYTADVFYVADAKFNLYFLSGKKTRHAAELLQNPRVAATIYDPLSAPGSLVSGIQIEGRVEVAKGMDLVQNFPRYLKLFPATKINLELLKQVDADSRLFKLIPEKVFYTDKRIFEKRKEIVL